MNSVTIKAIEINAVSTAHPAQGPHISGWPQPLQDQYPSFLGSFDDHQKAQLRVVLGKHVDLFAKSANDLGGKGRCKTHYHNWRCPPN